MIRLEKETNDDYDVIFNKADYKEGRRDYDRTGDKSGIRIPKGIIESKRERIVPIQDNEGYITGSGTNTLFFISFYVTSDRLLKFMDMNTDVEWANILMESKDGIEINFLMTSHQENTVSESTQRLSFYYGQGYRLIRHDHNHPNGNLNASDEDRKFASDHLKDFPNARFRIFSKGKYRSYTP